MNTPKNTLNLNVSDPAMLVDRATPAELMVAIIDLEQWSDNELNAVNRMIAVWSARAIAHPGDREGISELQRLIHYALNRSKAAATLPAEFRYRWKEASDMLEARRLNLANADPKAQIARRHVPEILQYLLSSGVGEQLQSGLVEHLGVTTGRVTQLISTLEANGLVTKRKHGRDNLLKLTETGLLHTKSLEQKNRSDVTRGASFLRSAS
jgi:DNA-binding MarR family transcriptional regulator